MKESANSFYPKLIFLEGEVKHGKIPTEIIFQTTILRISDIWLLFTVPYQHFEKGSLRFKIPNILPWITLAFLVEQLMPATTTQQKVFEFSMHAFRFCKSIDRTTYVSRFFDLFKIVWPFNVISDMILKNREFLLIWEATVHF